MSGENGGRRCKFRGTTGGQSPSVVVSIVLLPFWFALQLPTSMANDMPDVSRLSGEGDELLELYRHPTSL